MSALAPDPAYRRRLQRAIERALTAELGEDGYRRLLAEVRRRETVGAARFTERRSPHADSVGVEVEGGDLMDEK